jgi:hypothetical protein
MPAILGIMWLNFLSVIRPYFNEVRSPKMPAILGIMWLNFLSVDAVDIGKTIHPHPTLGESIGMAAEIAHGSCTDVPPAKK